MAVSLLWTYVFLTSPSGWSRSDLPTMMLTQFPLPEQLSTFPSRQASGTTYNCSQAFAAQPLPGSLTPTCATQCSFLLQIEPQPWRGCLAIPWWLHSLWPEGFFPGRVLLLFYKPYKVMDTEWDWAFPTHGEKEIQNSLHINIFREQCYSAPGYFHSRQAET